jgi:predicted metal-binding protein
MSSHSRKAPPLHPVEPDWQRGLVLVCSECDGGRGVGLAADLKHALKEAGHKKTVRVARVRCLGLCPKHGVAATVTGPDRAAQSYAVDAKDSGAAAALQRIVLRDCAPEDGAAI